LHTAQQWIVHASQQHIAKVVSWQGIFFDGAGKQAEGIGGKQLQLVAVALSINYNVSFLFFTGKQQ
jgi:hypothetical protein